ncbi:MAG TPA: phage portal protein [Candidatus Enterenecus merdae]|nr:phage portal protein [Candidatus Enterenecus merdae]
MSGLSDFLNPILPEEQEVYISDRFVQHDEKGNVVKGPDGKPLLRAFRVRALTQAENDEITKRATRTTTVKGQKVSQLDSLDYGRRLVVAATVEPDFSNSALCQHFETLDPLEVPGRMLLSGEYNKLVDAITTLSGFGDNVEDEAKN